MTNIGHGLGLFDINTEKAKPNLLEFLANYYGKYLEKSKTCFKNSLNPRYIKFFITNSTCRFQNTTSLAFGLSDFRKMILKSTFEKLNPKKVVYRNYK